MGIKQKIESLNSQLDYWETKFIPSGNMGKWGRQTKIDSIKEKLDQLNKGIDTDIEDTTIDDLVKEKNNE